jgi:hypothetical protein
MGKCHLSPQDWADSGGCAAGGFNRRSVLQGVAMLGHPQATAGLA